MEAFLCQLFILQTNGMDMGNKIIIGMNIDQKVIRQLNINVIDISFFDGNENNWEESETEVESWNINDSNLPDWLREYI